MKSFSSILQAWMRYKGVTEDQVAESLNKTKAEIMLHSAGATRNPRIDTIAEYAQVFDVTVPQFLEGPPDKDTEPVGK